MFVLCAILVFLLIAILAQIANLKADVAVLKNRLSRLERKPLLGDKEVEKPVKPTKVEGEFFPIKVESLVPGIDAPSGLKVNALPAKPASVSPLAKPVVKALEKPAAKAAAPSAARPAALAAPKKAPAPAARPAFNLEKIFMENIFNKLGAIAIIVGVAIFIKLLSPFVVFTPLKQVVAAYLLGLALTLAAWRIHKKQMKAYAEVLMGTGFAVFFIATYGATSYYDLLPDFLALLVGSLLVLLSYGVSHRFKSSSTMVIGMLGAYLNPLIIGYCQSAAFLYIYFVYVNMITAVYTYINQPKIWLNYVNLLLTSFYLFAYSLYREPIHFAFPAILWAVYMLFDLLTIRKGGDYKTCHRGLSVLNYVLLLFFSFRIFGLDCPLAMGLCLSAVALIYGVLAYLCRSSSSLRASLYLTGGMLAMSFATYFITNDTLRICAWAGEAVACGLALRRWSIAHLEKWALGLMLCSFISALLWMSYEGGMLPFWNERMIQLGLPSLCALGVALLLQERFRTIASFLKFLSLGSAFILLSVEVHALMCRGSALSALEVGMIYHFIAFAYVPIALRLFQQTKYVLFAVTGYAVYGLSMISLFGTSFVLSAGDGLFLIINLQLLAYASAMGLSYFVAKDAQQRGLVDQSHFFKWMVLTLSYAIAAFELQRFILLIGMSNEFEIASLYTMLALIVAPAAIRLYRQSCYSLFAVTGYGMYAAAVLTLLILPMNFCVGEGLWLLLNLQFLSCAVAVGVSYLMSRDAQQCGVIGEQNFFKWMMLSLTYVMAGFELNRLLALCGITSDFTKVSLYLLLFFSYVPAATRMYQLSKFSFFQVSAYFIYAVSLLALVFKAWFGVIAMGDVLPFCNTEFLVYLVAIGMSIYLMRAAKQQQNLSLAHTFAFLALGLTYWGAIMMELNRFFLRCHINLPCCLMLHVCFAMLYAVAAIHLYRKSQSMAFAVAGYFVYALAILIVSIGGLAIANEQPYLWLSLLNWRSLAYAFSVAATLLMARGRAQNFFRYLSIALGFCYVGTECTAATYELTLQAQQLSLSVAWVLYSFIMMGCGIFKDIKCLKMAGICIVIFSACKIVLYDLSKIDALSKTIAFLLLGAVLMSVSYYYTKKMNKK